MEFRALEIFKSHQFTADDAEALIEYIREAKSDTLATKKDIENVRLEIRDTELSLIKEIKSLEVKIEQSSNNNIKWFVGVILAQTGLIFTLLKIFEKI